MKTFFTLAFAALFSSLSFAQSGYKIGAAVADFTLNDTKSQAVSLASLQDAKAVVVVFTSVNCPYANLYEARLQNLATAYAAKGVRFLYVNPVIGLDDGGDTMKDINEKVNSGQYASSYLIDEDQRISKQFGAVKTPEVFVLQKAADGFVLRYKGAIDDNPQVEAYVQEKYLKGALDQVLAGRSVSVPDRRVAGCMIKQF